MSDNAPSSRPIYSPIEYYGRRLDGKLANELLGIARALIFDGIVSEDESRLLREWLHAHPAAVASFPGRELAQRLHLMYRDGVADEEERAELKLYLESLVGVPRGESPAQDWTTQSPFDDPAPPVDATGRSFCFTGTFAYGKRTKCIAVIEERGGISLPRVTRELDFLVVGEIGSDAWLTSSYGRKIETAMNHRSKGHPIRLVRESHWLQQLGVEPPRLDWFDEDE